ncbi:MASE3 domain-containing protein [Bacillus alkalicellulosilyticus]|uniref:MASE3 domain-containing protein n=1 Tax=Alkalihalobacterium alkalicellulosilyticum TaxID=1912214 RepID=UPI00099657E5|nr:MASE3 domain-containing protein [Bacillus alkalicellulosilyticus]
MGLTKIEKNTVTIAVVGLLSLLALFSHISIYLHIENHLLAHTILEMISVAISVSIVIYGWFTFSITKSLPTFVLTIGFMVVAFFDLVHTFSYPGVNLLEPNLQASVWFWLIARLTEAFTIVMILALHHRDQTVGRPYMKYVVLLITSGLVFTLKYVISSYSNVLPILVEPGIGPTTIKNSIEYGVAFIHLIAIVYLWKVYKRDKNAYYLNLILAFYFLILASLSLTVYTDVNDATIIIGHIFKVIGYFYILKGFYYFYLHRPFEKKHHTEQQLADLESQLVSFFQETKDAMVIYNLSQNKIIRRNQAFELTFGYETKAEREVKYAIQKYIENKKRKKGTDHFQTTLKSIDNYEVDVYLTSAPILSKSTKLFAIMIRDISVQVKAERKIEQARRELQETIQQHHGVIFKLKKQNGVFVITLVDGKLVHQKGIIPEAIIGMDVKQAFPLLISSEVETLLWKAWNGEEIVYNHYSAVGEVLLFSVIPLRREGKVVELIGTISDITTLIKTEELLRKSEKLSVIGELAAGFAHEIRNPLTTIKGFLQLIQTEEKEQKNDYLTIMLNEISRLEMITNEFMVVAKPQAVKYIKTDIIEIVEKVIQFLRPQTILNSIEIFLEVNEESAFVYCDVNQLKQVFINLYKNAMEAMPDGGNIKTQIFVTDDNVTISIIDEGCGIPEEIIPRLGEPFYTLKEKGTGLGLMVSHKIIDSHHGSIEITSQVNIGTTITITLPLIKE